MTKTVKDGKVTYKNKLVGRNMSDHIKYLQTVRDYFNNAENYIQYKQMRSAILAIENMQAYIKKLNRLSKKFN